MFTGRFAFSEAVRATMRAIRMTNEPDELGPWSAVTIERLGDDYLVQALGPMSRSIAEDALDLLDVAEPVDRPFDFIRRAIVEDGRVIVIACRTQAVADLMLADAFNGIDHTARWERSSAELDEHRSSL